MASAAVVEDLNVFADCQRGLLMVKAIRAVDEIFLQRREERLDHRVVVAQP
jgi:hypothetical protein